MSAGFSLLELVIAMAIAALFAAAVATAVPPLQAVFEQTPAAIDLHQRARTAVDAIAQAVRTAEHVVLFDPHPSDGSFRQLQAIAPAVQAAQGILVEDQGNPDDDLLLSDVGCPYQPEVCGFVPGTTAIIDGQGRFDLFAVGSVSESAWSISPERGFDESYAAGARVMEVDAYTFRLDQQPDGSFTLIRRSAAGAIQPIVDRVDELRLAHTFDSKGVDVTLSLRRDGGVSGEVVRRIAILPRNAR